MNYYIIKDNLDEKIVGSDYPQVHKFIKEYNPDAPNALFSLYKYRSSFPEYIPDLDGLMVSGSSKLTDIVSNSFSSDFYLMNERTKNLFENYKLCPYRVYPVGLYKRKIKHDYYLLLIKSDYTDYVDYEKTSFVKCDIIWKSELIPVNVNSKSEYIEMRKELEKEKGAI